MGPAPREGTFLEFSPRCPGVLNSTKHGVFTLYFHMCDFSAYQPLSGTVPLISVQFNHSVMSDSLRIAARQASLSSTNSQSSLKLTSIELVMPSSHLILCRPLLLLPPIPPSIRVFCNESTLHMRWPKYWSFGLSIIPSKEIPGLISMQSKGLSRVFSNTTVQNHQFFGAQLSSQSNSLISIHDHRKNHSLD